MYKNLNPFEILISAIVFVSIDFIYLKIIANYFKNQIKLVQGSPVEINMFGLVMCYIFLVFGFNYFIIQPRKSIKDAFLLGIVIYSVYEFTNYALLKDWKLLTVIMDTIWGGILFALTTFIVYKIFGVNN
jgi:uncharacterized membrane protein